MSELDRRLLLAGAGLAGVAALGRLAKAGPLEPPPGPVSPTGKTLTEVYDKIARTDAGLAEPRIPVESLPADENGTRTITQSGSYYLKGELTTAVTHIRIDASHVTLDLNGYTVPPSGFSGIDVRANYVTIHNGTISHIGLISTGIRCIGNIQGLCCENLTFTGSGSDIAGSGNAEDSLSRSTFRNCKFLGSSGNASNLIVNDNVSVFGCVFHGGAGGLWAGSYCHVSHSSFKCAGIFKCLSIGSHGLIEHCRFGSDESAIGCVATGDECLILGCTVSQLSGIGGSVALNVGAGCEISRCVVSAVRTGVVLGSGSTCHGTTIKGGRLGALIAGDRCVIEDCNIHSIPLLSTPAIAMTLGNRCVARRNVLSDVEAGVAIRANGNHNRIEENTVSSCGTGIETIGTGNLVARNHCTLNTTDYSLAPGTKAGPIVSSPADPNGSHPWANFAT